MNVPEWQTVRFSLRLFLIESGECRRKSLSHTAIVWSILGEPAPDRVSRSKLVIDSCSQSVRYRKHLVDGQCSSGTGRIRVVGDGIQT